MKFHKVRKTRNLNDFFITKKEGNMICHIFVNGKEIKAVVEDPRILSEMSEEITDWLNTGER